MDKNPLNKGVISNNSVGIGPATRAMVQARARELSLLTGHRPPYVRHSDYEQAKRELTGESDIDRQDAVLEALPEEKRGDPVPGSTGHQVCESPSEDEDDEGRSETEQLVDESTAEADRDRMFQAARAAAKTDGGESKGRRTTPPQRAAHPLLQL